MGWLTLALSLTSDQVTEQVVAVEVHVAHRCARLVEEHPACEEDAVLTEQRPRRTHPWSCRVQEPGRGEGAGVGG